MARYFSLDSLHQYPEQSILKLNLKMLYSKNIKKKQYAHIVIFLIREYFHWYIHEQNDKECQETLTKAQLYRWHKSHQWWLDDTCHINTNFAFDNSGLYEKKLIYETSKTLRAKQLAVHLDWMDTSFYYICSHLYHGTKWKKQVCMHCKTVMKSASIKKIECWLLPRHYCFSTCNMSC